MSSVDAPQSSEAKEHVISAKSRKSSFFLNPTSDASNELLQLLLSELKEMRMEMKEMKEDVSVMKTEQDNQKEVLKEIGEIQKYHQESLLKVHLEQKNQKEDLSRITESMGDIRENQQKLQEDVGTMKAEQEDQKEVLKEITKEMKENKESLKEVGVNQKKLEEYVTRKQQNQEQILQELKENISLNLKKIEKEPELYSQKDIRRRINGKWKNINYQNSYIWTNFEYDIFMIKLNRDDCFTRYKLGGKHQDGYMTSVENNTIVIRDFLNQGEEYWRHEYYIENERLHRVFYHQGTLSPNLREIYERVGDPDS